MSPQLAAIIAEIERIEAAREARLLGLRQAFTELEECVEQTKAALP